MVIERSDITATHDWVIHTPPNKKKIPQEKIFSQHDSVSLCIIDYDSQADFDPITKAYRQYNGPLEGLPEKRVGERDNLEWGCCR